MTDQSHNLNAAPVCQLARVILGGRYSRQNGGTKDFWDSLRDGERRIFQLAMNEAMKQAQKLGLSIEDMIDERVK